MHLTNLNKPRRTVRIIQKGWLGLMLLGCLLIPPVIRAEIIILKDGTKIIGQVKQGEKKLEVTTKFGVLSVDKDDIKAIYQDVATILKSNRKLLDQSKDLINDALELKNGEERNKKLDAIVESLKAASGVCEDVLTVVDQPEEIKQLSAQMTEANQLIKLIYTFKVSDKDIPPPPEESPAEEPTEPPVSDGPSPKDKEIARAFYKLAEKYFDQEEYTKALDELAKALKYYPGFTRGLYKTAAVYERLDNELEALTAYRACWKNLESLDPLPAELEIIKKDVRLKTDELGRFDIEFDDYRQEFIKASLTLGKDALADQDYALADNIFRLIRALDRDYHDLDTYLDQIDKAKQQGLSKPDKELTDLYYKLGQESFKKSNYAEAQKNFTKALKHAQVTYPVHYELAQTCEKLKQPAPALCSYRLAAQELTDKTALTDDEKKMLQQINRAIKRLDKLGKEFTALKNELGDELTQLGNTYLSQKYRYFAARALNHALLVNPDNTRAKKLLAKCGVTVSIAEEPPTRPVAIAPGTNAIFNGRNIKNWLTPRDYFPGAWQVKEKHLVADPPRLNQPTILVLKETPPQNYTLFVRMIIEQRKTDNPDNPSNVNIVLATENRETFPSFENFVKTNFQGVVFTYKDLPLPLVVEYTIHKSQLYTSNRLTWYQQGNRAKTEEKQGFDHRLLPERARESILALAVVNLRVKFETIQLTRQ